MIENITKEQEKLILSYLEKWQKLVFITGKIDKFKAECAVKDAYNLIGIEEPEIIFCQSPKEALNTLINQSPYRLENDPKYTLSHLMWNQVKSQISIDIIRFINQHTEPRKRSILRYNNQINIHLKRQLAEQTALQNKRLLTRYSLYVTPEKWANYGSKLDFCISVLNCHHNNQNWEVFQALVRHCGCIFSFEKASNFGESTIQYKKMVIICERPIQISLDREYRLHAEGKPAIQFADGYSLYSYHGITLPEKYGKVHPTRWQSKWLLKEDNAALRQVLIQGIGYGRICQELQAVELDNWQAYTLLKIDSTVDVEPVYLLKMICPSSGRIHILRVPPDTTSAKEAIIWVNWGINPFDFAEQT